MLDTLKEWWGLFVLVASGIGALLRFFWQRGTSRRTAEKARRENMNMLYAQLEELKKKVILNVAKEVAQATELAEKQRIIDGLRLHCPECYEVFMRNFLNDGERNKNKGAD